MCNNSFGTISLVLAFVYHFVLSGEVSGSMLQFLHAKLGVGLMVARRIVAAHQGKITVEAGEGGGG